VNLVSSAVKYMQDFHFHPYMRMFVYSTLTFRHGESVAPSRHIHYVSAASPCRAEAELFLTT
jgi:hypothetical protein